MSVIVLIPLLAIVLVLVLKRHMMIAGLVGAIVAMVIGRMGIAGASDIILKTVPGMLSMLTPIMYSATALAVAKTGGFAALIKLARRVTGNRLAVVAGVIVLIQALATYAAGLGAGNTMVTGPLAATAVGVVPELIAGMAIATAASFVTSPSSAESATLSKIAGINVGDYSEMMRPYTIAFWILSIALAVYGVHRRGKLITGDQEEIKESTGELLKLGLAPLYFVVVVLAGKYLNGLIGYNLFNPPFNMISTVVLATVLSKKSPDEMAENLVNGSSFILIRLFAIGVFLGFINILGEIGTFKYIAQIAASAPKVVFVPAGMLAGFLVAVPAGAYSVGVISLVLPVLAAVGMTPIQMGLVAMAIAMGTQMSMVQINVAALSQTFDRPIEYIVKNNAPYALGALGTLMVIGLAL